MAPVVRYLVLWLTTGCNLNCSYCYRGEDNSPQLMSVKVAENALRLAATSGLPFHVQLAGGEPTLATQMIYDIARHVRASSLPATLGLQTNGTLINGRFPNYISLVCAHTFFTNIAIPFCQWCIHFLSF